MTSSTNASTGFDQINGWIPAPVRRAPGGKSFGPPVEIQSLTQDHLNALDQEIRRALKEAGATGKQQRLVFGDVPRDPGLAIEITPAKQEKDQRTSYFGSYLLAANAQDKEEAMRNYVKVCVKDAKSLDPNILKGAMASALVSDLAGTKGANILKDLNKAIGEITKENQGASDENNLQEGQKRIVDAKAEAAANKAEKKGMGLRPERRGPEGNNAKEAANKALALGMVGASEARKERFGRPGSNVINASAELISNGRVSENIGR